MERKGKTGKRKKRGMNFIPYDYEAAYNKALGDLHEWIVEQMFSHGKKVFVLFCFVLFCFVLFVE